MTDKQIIIDYKEYLDLVKENETMRGIINDWAELENTYVFVDNYGRGKWILKGEQLKKSIDDSENKYHWKRVK